MYDTLLALHLISAAISFVTVVMFSAWALGAPAPRIHFVVADQAWNISGAGLVVFGIWLTLHVEAYSLTDGWILGALVLFGATAVFGALARTASLPSAGEVELTRRQVGLWHWLRTAAVVAILVLMVWKPGA